MGLTYQHAEVEMQGLSKQPRVAGAQIQQHPDVALSLEQLQLSEVHQGGPLNDHKLDEEQRVEVADCLQR